MFVSLTLETPYHVTRIKIAGPTIDESELNAMSEAPSLSELFAALSQPAAYPFPIDRVDVRQTHISVVFLVGAKVFKLKKPVRLPFLDFSTLELRKHDCDEEVRLNRRLAPDVYLGVVPVRATAEGLKVGEHLSGPTVDWVVEMARLPDEAMYLSRMERDVLTVAQVEKLASRVADFHWQARQANITDSSRVDKILEYGHFDKIAASIRDNIAFAESQVGGIVSAAVCSRLREATENALARFEPLLQRRVTERMICDLHGDLHLDHVYLFEDRQPPSDLVIVDCIEFNEAFRFIDVVADIAFCSMDFKFRGRRDLAKVFADAYFAASNDETGRELLPLYTAYRAAVRGKVDGILAAEPEVPPEQRDAAATRSRGYWLLALGELETIERRPVLVLSSGLPGTGKSTVARGFAEADGFHWIRSDAVRKELAQQSSTANATDSTAGFKAGIYSAEWTERTYHECLSRASTALQGGERVVVDATFHDNRRRMQFVDAAVRLGIPVIWLVCEAEPATAKSRLEARRNDVSDADWRIYQQIASAWQPACAITGRVRVSIDAELPAAEMVQRARTSVYAFLNDLA